LFWRKTGINPLTFTTSDDAHGFNGRVFTMISIIEMVVVAIYAFRNSWYEYLLPFWYLEHEVMVIFGWALLLLSLVMVWVAQSQMASSWRIGVDNENKTELVTKGLFSISRNPIFLGIMMANIGLFFVIPNAFTLLIIALSTISINTQIRLEEAFMKQTFGMEYSDYTRRVRRWF
jgi:protein-S-isoprenylcysteine O-methyltransferase Ste14